jgi:hypothetical protein
MNKIARKKKLPTLHAQNERAMPAYLPITQHPAAQKLTGCLWRHPGHNAIETTHKCAESWLSADSSSPPGEGEAGKQEYKVHRVQIVTALGGLCGMLLLLRPICDQTGRRWRRRLCRCGRRSSSPRCRTDYRCCHCRGVHGRTS